MPWRVRVWWYALVGHLAGAALGFMPRIYGMLAADGARYHMGKDSARQIESIKVMELVLEEFERRQISADRVAAVYARLKADGAEPDDIPYALAEALLDDAARARLLKHVRAL